MPDSDEEFFTASEDEFDDDEASTKVVHENAPKIVPDVVIKPSSVGQEEKFRKADEEKLEPKETVVEEVSIIESSSIELITESQSDFSLTPEKKKLLEEVVQETANALRDSISFTVTEDASTLQQAVGAVPEDLANLSATQSNSTESGKVVDSHSEKSSSEDAGWDDFSAEENSAQTEQSGPISPPDSDLAPVSSEDNTASENTGSGEGAGWDDWGEDEEDQKNAGCSSPSNSTLLKSEDVQPKFVRKEVPAASTDSWDDWSLIDEKKVEQTLKEPSSTETISGSKEEKDSDWGWGGLVSAVGETFSSTIESSLGLPSADEFARRRVQEEKHLSQPGSRSNDAPISDSSNAQPKTSSGGGLFSGLLSGGSELLTGGIDALEALGKKTFEAVTVADKESGKRRLLFTEERGENLADVLQELRTRQDAEQSPIKMGSSQKINELPDIRSVFERSEGAVHLEALEMLSSSRQRSSTSKVSRQYLNDLQLVDVESTTIDDEEFSQQLTAILKRINLPYDAKPLVDCDKDISNRLSWMDNSNSKEAYSICLNAIVNFLASSVQVVSKLANLILIVNSNITHNDFVDLYDIICQRINHFATFSANSISEGGDDRASELSTQILIESSMATKMVEKSFTLLSPFFSA